MYVLVNPKATDERLERRDRFSVRTALNAEEPFPRIIRQEQGYHAAFQKQKGEKSNEQNLLYCGHASRPQKLYSF